MRLFFGCILALMFILMALSGAYEGNHCDDLTASEAAEAGCYRD